MRTYREQSYYFSVINNFIKTSCHFMEDCFFYFELPSRFTLLGQMVTFFKSQNYNMRNLHETLPIVTFYIYSNTNGLIGNNECSKPIFKIPPSVWHIGSRHGCVIKSSLVRIPVKILGFVVSLYGCYTFVATLVRKYPI